MDDEKDDEENLEWNRTVWRGEICSAHVSIGYGRYAVRRAFVLQGRFNHRVHRGTEEHPPCSIQYPAPTQPVDDYGDDYGLRFQYPATSIQHPNLQPATFNLQPETCLTTPRIYLDTSVFGGCFDEEFAEDSLRLIEEIRSGKFRLVISQAVLAELKRAPDTIREMVAGIPSEEIEIAQLRKDAEKLKQAYLEANVVGQASAKDAEHIALATVAHVNMIVSWNFRHIVHFDKISGYHKVNRDLGYGEPAICSPKMVINYED